MYTCDSEMSMQGNRCETRWRVELLLITTQQGLHRVATLDRKACPIDGVKKEKKKERNVDRWLRRRSSNSETLLKLVKGHVRRRYGSTRVRPSQPIGPPHLQVFQRNCTSRVSCPHELFLINSNFVGHFPAAVLSRFNTRLDNLAIKISTPSFSSLSHALLVRR